MFDTNYLFAYLQFQITQANLRYCTPVVRPWQKSMHEIGLLAVAVFFLFFNPSGTFHSFEG